jgi:hypothetical protein
MDGPIWRDARDPDDDDDEERDEEEDSGEEGGSFEGAADLESLLAQLKEDCLEPALDLEACGELSEVCGALC